MLILLWRLTSESPSGSSWAGSFGGSSSTRRTSLRLAEHAEGFVALAATFLAYGTAEAVEGYGFLAVFVCACTIRAGERSHGYHRVLHSWVEQIERLLTVAMLLLLGGAVARGAFTELGLGRGGSRFLAFLLVVRPLAGWVALRGGRTGPRERAVISFFGVRGVGSLFYIAYAVQEGDYSAAGTPDRLWAIVGLAVVGSVLIHGVAATPVMRSLDRTRQKVAQQRARHHPSKPATPPSDPLSTRGLQCKHTGMAAARKLVLQHRFRYG